MNEHNPVFVFGSNLAGRHGRGAALFARQHRGAIYGQGVGRQGDSYAIPTKDRNLNTLPLDEIGEEVKQFFIYAALLPNTTFNLTPIGTGLAGYTKEEIWPLIEPYFEDAPNVFLTESWYYE